MSKVQIQIRSWNRYLTRYFAVKPEVMGRRHNFPFDDSLVSIIIPDLEEVSRKPDSDQIASVRARRTIDNEPLEYEIHKVDVEVSIPVTVVVPSEVLTRNPNAYDLFSQQEQDHLNNVAWQHQQIAEKAFEYWLRIIRWTCNDSRIGQNYVESFNSGWTTRLIDEKSNRKFWIQSSALYVSKYPVMTIDDWEEAQVKLSRGEFPPVYIELKFDAEERISVGDYRRALLDLAMSCETFLRYKVLHSLPSELSLAVVTHLEDANIRQYLTKFFPEIIDEDEQRRFKKLKSNLHSLFDRRNKLVHMGKGDGIDEQLCLRFVKVTDELLSLKIQELN